MTNPYISRGPVQNPAMFFGRIHELNSIASFLKGNQSISIVGPRKIGKTSILFHLMRPETMASLDLPLDNLFIYFDCEVLGDGNYEELLSIIAIEIADRLEMEQLPPEPTLENVINTPSRIAFEMAVRKLNRRGLRVVLILDEFEQLSRNPQLKVNFFNALRSAAGRFQLVFITASARPLIQLTFAEETEEILSSPFFNIFAQQFLGVLASDECLQLITQPATLAQQPVSPETILLVSQLAGRHPFMLQVTCFHAFEHPNELTEIERRTKEELNAHFQYYWQKLSPVEQEVVLHLEAKATIAETDPTLTAVFRDLVQKCILFLDNNNYVYPSQMWADFVALQQETLPTSSNRPSTLRDLSGLTIGSYKVIAPIGRGGMGEVYKGKHTRLERIVAVKVMTAQIVTNNPFYRRFEREAQVIASLKHPNIVQIFDFGDVEGIPYMIMEFVAGNDLADYLQQHGAMELHEALPIIEGVAHALDYAHSRELIHRDVKPSNILLQHLNSPAVPSQQIKPILTDFGIVKDLEAVTNVTGDGMMGTLEYVSPEQIKSAGNVTYHADIYSLGVLAYKMLTNELPFQEDSILELMLAHLEKPPPDPRLKNPTLPSHVAHALLKAMSKMPTDRFSTALEFAKTLRVPHHS